MLFLYSYAFSRSIPTPSTPCNYRLSQRGTLVTLCYWPLTQPYSPQRSPRSRAHLKNVALVTNSLTHPCHKVPRQPFLPQTAQTARSQGSPVPHTSPHTALAKQPCRRCSRHTALSARKSLPHSPLHMALSTHCSLISLPATSATMRPSQQTQPGCAPAERKVAEQLFAHQPARIPTQSRSPVAISGHCDAILPHKGCHKRSLSSSHKRPQHLRRLFIVVSHRLFTAVMRSSSGSRTPSLLPSSSQRPHLHSRQQLRISSITEAAPRYLRSAAAAAGTCG